MKTPDFKDVLDVACALISAGTSLFLTWKGRARWEPSKIDIPQLPQRVVGLLSAMLLFWSWFDSRWTRDIQRLQKVLIILCSLCVAAALLYLFITVTNGYYIKVGERRVRIIGGFNLTRQAQAEIKRHKPLLTVQEYLLTRAKNNPDRVWPRPSRAAMQVLFVVFYITLSVAGTGALSFAAQAYVNRHVATAREIPPRTIRRPIPQPTAKPAEPPSSQEKDSSPAPSAPGPPPGPSGAMPPESNPWGDEGTLNSSARIG